MADCIVSTQINNKNEVAKPIQNQNNQTSIQPPPNEDSKRNEKRLEDGRQVNIRKTDPLFMLASTKKKFGSVNNPTHPIHQSFGSIDVDMRNNISTSIRNKRRLEDDRRINRKKNDPGAMSASTRNDFGSNQQTFGSRNVNLRNFQNSPNTFQSGQQRNVNANAINTSEGRRPSAVYSNFSPQGSARNSFRDGRRLEDDRNVNSGEGGQGSRNEIQRDFGTRIRNQGTRSRQPSTVYSNFSPQGILRNSFRDGRRLADDRNVNSGEGAQGSGNEIQQQFGTRTRNQGTSSNFSPRQQANINTNIARRPSSSYSNFPPQRSQSSSFRTGKRLNEDRNVNDADRTRDDGDNDFNEGRTNIRRKPSGSRNSVSFQNDRRNQAGTRGRNQVAAGQRNPFRPNSSFDQTQRRPSSDYSVTNSNPGKIILEFSLY